MAKRKARGGRKAAAKIETPAAPAVAAASSTDPIVIVTAEDLCLRTGFSDSWHRKVAGRGYFPPPITGKYQLIPALQGLLKYQLEHADRAKESLAAKQELLLDKKIERADFDLGVSKEEFKSTAETSTTLMAISEELKSALSFHMLDQLPALNAGLAAKAQRKNNRDCLVAICKRFQEWAKTFDQTKQQKDVTPGKPLSRDPD